MAAQNPKPALKKNDEPISETTQKRETEETLSEKAPQHETNKAAVIVGVVGVMALLFMVSC